MRSPHRYVSDVRTPSMMETTAHASVIFRTHLMPLGSLTDERGTSIWYGDTPIQGEKMATHSLDHCQQAKENQMKGWLAFW